MEVLFGVDSVEIMDDTLDIGQHHRRIDQENPNRDNAKNDEIDQSLRPEVVLIAGSNQKIAVWLENCRETILVNDVKVHRIAIFDSPVHFEQSDRETKDAVESIMRGFANRILKRRKTFVDGGSPYTLYHSSIKHFADKSKLWNPEKHSIGFEITDGDDTAFSMNDEDLRKWMETIEKREGRNGNAISADNSKSVKPSWKRICGYIPESDHLNVTFAPKDSKTNQL